jgi:hypothetical protein
MSFIDARMIKDTDGQNISNKIGILNKRAENIVSVKEFGAVGDGVADDTTAIQNAINAVNTVGGGIVLFPVGTYKTISPLKLYSYVILQGVNAAKCIIKNENGTNIVETFEPLDTRYYGIQVNELTLDGVIKGTQIGLNIPHTSNSFFRNVIIKNIQKGIYMKAKDSLGQVTGAYYNQFFNPQISNAETAIYFDDTANENVVYGGKLYLSDNGAILYKVNSIKFFGTAFEANNIYHIKLDDVHNCSLYAPRMEGYSSCKGIYHNPTAGVYSNYVFMPHFQSLATEIEDTSKRLVILHDKGFQFNTRVHTTALYAQRNSGGSSPLVYMEDLNTTSGNPVTYKSKMSRYTGKHLEGVNETDTSVFEINYYGEYENKLAGRGIILKTPDGTKRYKISIDNNGQIITTLL